MIRGIIFPPNALHAVPRRLPVVFSIEAVSDILMAAPGPGLKYRAALSIS
jgi:integrase/recombinase XerD